MVGQVRGWKNNWEPWAVANLALCPNQDDEDEWVGDLHLKWSAFCAVYT